MTVLIAGKPTLDQGMRCMPWLTLALTVVLVGLYVAFQGAPGALIYDRAAILDGEAYRLLTGHLVHLDLRHLGFNAGAFAMLGAVYETSGAPRGRYVTLMLGSMAAISAVLLGLSPQTLSYCGLSAVLNALFAATVLGLWRDTRQVVWLLFLLGDLMKIGFEWRFGSIFNADLAWAPHYGAHLTGFLFGLAFEALAVRRGWKEPGAEPAAPGVGLRPALRGAGRSRRPR